MKLMINYYYRSYYEKRINNDEKLAISLLKLKKKFSSKLLITN